MHENWNDDEIYWIFCNLIKNEEFIQTLFKSFKEGFLG